MIKALLMILLPARTWEGIARTRRNLFFVLFLYLIPTLALSIGGEVCGRRYFQQHQADTPTTAMISDKLALQYAEVEFAAGIIVAFVLALMIKELSETFHNRNTYGECFTVAAYGLGPFMLLNLLNAIPVGSPTSTAWMIFAACVVFSIATLYHGVPHVLKPDPPHAFGLFFVGSILLVLVSGLARFITLMVYEERLKLPW